MGHLFPVLIHSLETGYSILYINKRESPTTPPLPHADHLKQIQLLFFSQVGVYCTHRVLYYLSDVGLHELDLLKFSGNHFLEKSSFAFPLKITQYRFSVIGFTDSHETPGMILYQSYFVVFLF